MTVSQSAHVSNFEPRWPVALVVIGVRSLLVELPDRIRLLPVWLLYMAAGVILAPLAVVALTGGEAPWPRVGEQMRALLRESRPRVVILECSAVTDLEYAALRTITASAEKVRSTGVTLWLAGLNTKVQRVIERSPLPGALGPARVYSNLPEAVRPFEKLGPVA